MRKDLAAVTLLGLGLTHCAPDAAPDVATARRAVLTDCEYLNPTLHAPLPTPVRFDQELLITDLAVVEDPCRTDSLASGCPSGTVGVWTFKALMTRMAGTRPVGVFVGDWLATFETAQTVNGFTLPARADARANFIDPWVIASGCGAGDPITGAGACALDLDNAPFRLLAIVNRVDQSGPGFGASEPGEARFVFGMLDASTGSALPGTVIFEYKLPTTRDAFFWASAWHQLSSITPGTAPYLSHLQWLLDEITLPGKMPGAPNNGSAIGQVRTNERVMDAVWELREYTLQGRPLTRNRWSLVNHPLAQTPDDSLNASGPLDAYLVANEPAILSETHVVDPSLIGGGSTAPLTWNVSGGSVGLSPDARHLFALATCNGCHSDETGTAFVHVDNRASGSTAPLSGFLSVAPRRGAGGSPATSHAVTDPVTGATFQYNEPWRRTCEVTRILNGDPDPYTKASGAH